MVMVVVDEVQADRKKKLLEVESGRMFTQQTPGAQNKAECRGLLAVPGQMRSQKQGSLKGGQCAGLWVRKEAAAKPAPKTIDLLYHLGCN
jgi:hypothetical protein